MRANGTNRKNPCARRVTPDAAYEVWRSNDGLFTTYVLKKYQTPEKEAQNPWAKWYCATSSPGTHGRLEYGDAYVATVKRDAHKLDYNPLAKTSVLCNECHEPLTEEELSVYSLQWRHSGDMYCLKHRVCPDDCRRIPCLLTQTGGQR